ncbi:four-carbon acid sugar kinase family protein [Tissierella sp. Yu-01]|uniref:four-carbon acid sugar kinase family protein n=1 Tax=Tissierella sp. Yu-01 TaxID=3035694 RepID=UPI00240DA84C|nr:four-carbon acid sugar kinase family protein [Tissierella sp. Yu-01]WFA08532.1 four-carbon acid sugar kinase family protein [Tissierella sp. Yu-01]
MDYVAIVADDLTGASDTGVKLSKRGYETNVIFNPNDIDFMLEKGKILSINSSTREKASDEAYQAVFQITQILKKNRYNKIYKKIDSVFRGNVAIEIEAVMNALNVKSAFLVPAIPDNGRYIIGGHLYIDEERESKLDIKTLLKSSSNCNIESIGIDDIRKGEKSLLAKLYGIHNDEKVIVLFDTEEEEDFQVIANTIKEYKKEFILSGASGIVNLLPEIWNLSNIDTPLAKIEKNRTHLIIAGSFHNSTGAQIKKLNEEFQCKLIIIDTEKVTTGKMGSNFFEQEIESICKDDEMSEIIIVAVDTLINPEITPDKENSEVITEFISNIALRIIESGYCKTITITGGETAYHVMQSLGALGMKLRDEIISGLPLGTVIGGIAKDMPLVTKSGGFGDPDALVKVIKYLNEDREDVKANAT